MRTLAWLIIALAVLAAVILAWRVAGRRSASAAPPASAPTILQIRQLSRLTVLEVPITEVRTARIDGYLGGLSLVLIVRGEAFYGCDLDRARFIECDADRRHAVLAAPPPRIERARLDLAASSVYRFDREGLWMAVPGPVGETRLVDLAMRAAQDDLTTTADQPQFHARARLYAASVIERFLASMGWTVEVRWMDAAASDGCRPRRQPQRERSRHTGLMQAHALQCCPPPPSLTPRRSHRPVGDRLRWRRPGRW